MYVSVFVTVLFMHVSFGSTLSNELDVRQTTDPLSIVSMQKQSFFGNKYYHFCTGSILSKQWILTAGHCFTDKEDTPLDELAVEVGSQTLNQGTRYKIADFFIHPEQSESIIIFKHDLALVKLQTSIIFTKTIQPVHLGTIKDQQEVLVRTGGWGRDHTTWTSSKKMRYLLVNTIKYNKCQELHAPRNNQVDKTMHICVGVGVGRNICFGDSGSPLFDVKTGNQVGVFSSLEDCSGDYPFLFIRIEPYIKWINNVTNLELSLD